jgi:uncharacterized membrane protein (UPF0127 family)
MIHANLALMGDQLTPFGVRHVEVVNRTRATVLCTHLEEARGAGQQARGLIGRQDLTSGHAMLFVRRRFEPFMWFHTVLMRFPIDIVFIELIDAGILSDFRVGDSQRDCWFSYPVTGRVVQIKSEMKPWRVSMVVFGARLALELASGAVGQSGTRIGDLLVFKSLS